MLRYFFKCVFLFCFMFNPVWGSEPDKELSPDEIRFLLTANECYEAATGGLTRNVKMSSDGPETPGYTGHFWITYKADTGFQLMMLPNAEPFCGGGLNYAEVVDKIAQDPHTQFDTFDQTCTFQANVVNLKEEQSVVRQDTPFVSQLGVIRGNKETFSLLVSTPDSQWNHTLVTTPLLCLHLPEAVGKTPKEDQYSNKESLCFIVVQPADMNTTLSTAEEPVTKSVCLLHGHINHDETDVHIFNAQRIAVFMLRESDGEPVTSVAEPDSAEETARLLKLLEKCS